MRLFCDFKTDEEKSNFFLSGRAVETGVIAPAISNDVAMAYHRCAQLKKENDALRAEVEKIPYGTIGKILTEVMNIAVANGADSRSMPDEYVEVAAWLCRVPGAKG